MHVLLMTIGTSGDVHPMVGLGSTLLDRGHNVTLATCGYFRELAESVGLNFVETGTTEEYLELTNHPDLWDPFKGFPYIVRKGIEPVIPMQYELIEQQLKEHPDTVVIANCLSFGSRIAQEKFGMKLITVHLQPSVIWSDTEPFELAKIGFIKRNGPRWLRRFFYWGAEVLFIDRVTLPVINGFRREIGLAPIKKTNRWWHSPDAVIGFFPEWYAPPQLDWPANVHLTHFPMWDESTVAKLDPEIEEFLNNGTPPVVLTAGTGNRFAKQFFEAGAKACQLLNQRAILLSKFPEHIPSHLHDGIVHFSYAPFSKLLPRSMAICHHGGIGTTSQALAAGIPQIVMPMAHDQPDNLARLRKIGVGDGMSPSGFKAKKVAAALDRLLKSTEVAQACLETRKLFVNRDGLAEAASLIEEEHMREKTSASGTS